MKILIVGAGSIGRRHAENAKAHGEVKIFDADPAKSDFKNIDDAFAWKPQAAVIATPHHTHIELASRAVDAGGDVLIEKPVSHEERGVTDFLYKAKAAGRQIFVVCNTRFHPAVQILKNNLAKIGKVYFARAHFGNYLPNMRPGADYKALYCANKNQGGGVILDVIHEIDYLSWILGGVESVSCESGKLSDLEIDVEDYAAMSLQHENGTRSEIHMDYLQQVRRRGCEIVGSKGTLIWQTEGKSPENCVVRLFTDGAWKVLFEDKALDTGVMYKTLMDKFIASVKSKKPDAELLQGQEALEGLKVALAAHLSAEQGKRIGVRKFRAVA